MTINERFKDLRKQCGKTQTEWGTILGITASGVSDIESGRRKVTEQHLIMLSNWKEKCVNIDWIRTGKGNPILEPQRNALMARAAHLLGEHDPVFEAFVETYSELNASNRRVLVDFFIDFTDKLAKKKE